MEDDGLSGGYTAHVREMRGADLKRVCNLEVVDVDRKIILN